MPHGTSDVFLDDLKIDLRHIVLGIGRALNYVGADGLDHPFRTAYIAQQCAKQLGWSEERQRFVHLTGVLYHCGVNTNADGLVGTDGKPCGCIAEECVRGYEYLNQSALLRPFANAVRHSHTPWPALTQLSLQQCDKDAANLIYVANIADEAIFRFAEENPAAPLSDAALPTAKAIAGGSGALFCEEFGAALTAAMRLTDFWNHLNGTELQNVTGNLGDTSEYLVKTDAEEAAKVSLLIARLVDGKSCDTVGHSERVALICQELARDIGFSPRAQSEIYLAGLLHDVGYVDTPPNVTLKQGKLNPDEFSIVQRHVKNVRPMLHRCFPGSRIAEWASNHHERLDGNGYPNHLKGNELDPGSRIVAIADIFQALSQKRPYRNRKTAEEIVRIMRAMVRDGQLDAEIFETLAARADHYYGIAAGYRQAGGTAQKPQNAIRHEAVGMPFLESNQAGSF